MVSLSNSRCSARSIIPCIRYVVITKNNSTICSSLRWRFNDIAIKKAWTAIAFKRPTAMLQPIIMPEAFGYGLQHTDPRICIVAGGLPIVEKGAFLGAVGASGGTIQEDIACCVESLKACAFTTEFDDPLKAKK